MTKLKGITFIILASFFLIFTNCTKYEDTSDLTLVVSQDRAIAHLGDTIPLTIIAFTTDDAIKSISVTKTGEIPITIPAISSNQNYSTTFNYIVNDSVGKLEFTIILYGYVSSPIIKTLTFSIVKDVEVTLGASASCFPGFINGQSLTTYNAANAFSNQSVVDLVYTYSATDGAVLGAPADTTIILPGWTTKNITKIGKILKENPEEVSKVKGTSVKNIAKDDMLGYITSNGTKGIIEVMDVTTGNNGNVSLIFMVLK